MTAQNTKAPAYSDAAHEQGMQAWRDMEARYEANRSAAERAADPTPEEAAHLAELAEATEAAAAATVAARTAWNDCLPNDVIDHGQPVALGRVRLVNGFVPALERGRPIPTKVYTMAERQAAEKLYLRADEEELAARVAEADYQALLTRVGAQRQRLAEQKEARR